MTIDEIGNYVVNIDVFFEAFVPDVTINKIKRRLKEIPEIRDMIFEITEEV